MTVEPICGGNVRLDFKGVLKWPLGFKLKDDSVCKDHAIFFCLFDVFFLTYSVNMLSVWCHTVAGSEGPPVQARLFKTFLSQLMGLVVRDKDVKTSYFI